MSDHSDDHDFLQVVRESLDDVYRYALHLTADQHQAEELVQEVFLRAQRKWHQIRNREQAKQWLFAICRRLFLNSRRRRNSLSLVPPEDLDTIACDYQAPPNDGGERLRQALRALPPRCRVLLVMFYFEGLSYREIADRLRLPIGTVMSGLYRAKQRLRQELALAPERRSGISVTPKEPPRVKGSARGRE